MTDAYSTNFVVIIATLMYAIKLQSFVALLRQLNRASSPQAAYRTHHDLQNFAVDTGA